MSKQKGIVHIIPLIFVVVLVVGLYLVVNKIGKVPTSQPTKEPTVELQTQYKNPFSKEAQYVNPFAQQKNAFDGL